MGDLTKADLEGKVVFVRADLNVSRQPRARSARRGHFFSAALQRSAWCAPTPVTYLSQTSLTIITKPSSQPIPPIPPHPPHPPSLPPTPGRRPHPQVPLADGVIGDDTRIRAAVPTLKYLVDNGAKVLLSSHLGRPKKGPEDKFRLTPIVPRLSELLGAPVVKADDCIGAAVTDKLATMSNGQVGAVEAGV